MQERFIADNQEVFSVELPKVFSDATTLTFMRNIDQISEQDFVFEMHDVRRRRNDLIYKHAKTSGEREEHKASGVAEQVVEFFENYGFVHDKLAVRYLCKTRFLGTVKSLQEIHEESLNF